jgi:hypothetical protein
MIRFFLSFFAGLSDTEKQPKYAISVCVFAKKIVRIKIKGQNKNGNFLSCHFRLKYTWLIKIFLDKKKDLFC